MNDLPDYVPDPNECPNCGAPTGGWPCENANASGFSCRNLIELAAAEDAQDWNEYERLAAEIIECYPQTAATLAADLTAAKERAGVR